MAARSRRICCTVTGRSRDWRSSPRHCSTYWISSRSRPGRQRTSIHSHPRPGSARAAANSPGSGRPARRQPWQWVWQNGVAGIAHRPQAGTRQASGGGDGRHVVQGRQPAADAGPAGPVPLLEVLLAQAAPAMAVVAAGNLAGRRRPVPGPVRAGGRREHGQVRLARLVPALTVAPAQVPDAGRPFAAGHRARRPAEHRVSRVEGQHPGPELRAHRGHQLFQQAGRNLVLPGLRGIRAAGAAHRLSSSPSKTVAVTLTATPPRTPRACR